MSVEGYIPGSYPPERNRPRNHYNAKVPAMQLASQLSAFNNTGVKMNGKTIDATELLVAEENSPRPAVKPTTAKNLTLNSGNMGKLVAPPDEGDDDESLMPTAHGRRAIATHQNPAESVIGGQTPTEMWRTTSQSQQNGDSTQKAGSRTKKFAPNSQPLNIVSPITGEVPESIDMYAKKKQQQEEAAAALAAEEAAYAAQLDEMPPLLKKLREELARRGAQGILGLSKKFKIMDDDNSKTLCKAEFRKAMKETKIPFTDAEITELFILFDREGEGEISYDEFIQTLSDPMNGKRRRLVDMAYNVLDKDGSGLVDLTDMEMAYDVSKHPDFIRGKKTKKQIVAEMLDAFDVGGEKDGKVTRQEFRNYYQAISGSIGNDEYFELMIRNAWHISGGEGAAANSSNLRILVTHADGTQTVEEVKNDIGLRSDDKAGIASRLAAQGINAAAIATTGSAGDKSSNGPAKRPATTGSSGRKGATAASAAPDFGLQAIIQRMKNELKQRGANGFAGLQRKFKIMDDDGSKSLNLAEFKKAMKEMKLDLNDKEMRMVFEYFDKDNGGSIDFEEFIQGLRDPLSERRKNLVMQVFKKLDTDGSGIIEREELLSKYNASKHPDVIAKKRTEQEVLREFMATFEVGEAVDGCITTSEFENYYANVGASIDNEDYFELMIRNAWRLPGGEGAAANTANRRVMTTGADGRQQIQAIDDDLGLDIKNKDAMMARLKKQGVDATSFDFGGAVEQEKPRSAPKRGAAPPRLQPEQFDPSVMINYLRKHLSKGGDLSVGLINLQREFREMDTDGSSLLDPNEFAMAMKNCGISLNTAQLKSLFDFFDADRSQTISYEEFISAIRGVLPVRRRRTIELVFKKLDVDGSGLLDPQRVMKIFNPAAHPEVLAQKTTAEDIRRKFFDGFDVGGEVEGKVTKAEFVNYYHNISAGIDNDDYFDAVMSNVWKLSNTVAKVQPPRSSTTAPADLNHTLLHSEDMGAIDSRFGAPAPSLKNQLMGKRNDTQEVSAEAPRSEKPSPKQIAVAGPNAPNRLPADRKQGPMLLNMGKNGSKDAMHTSLRAGGPANGIGGAAPKPSVHALAPGVGLIVQRIIDDVKSRGLYGYTELQRLFWMMDADGSKSLDLAEFKKAMTALNIDCSAADLRAVFEHFDIDKSGTIDFEEFLSNIRDPMSEIRQQLVSIAFKKLDLNNQDIVDAAEVAAAYDTTNHPEVIAGRLTAEEALNEFLETFDVGREVEGKVTKQEFITYYNNIGACISNEDYFELLVANTWQLGAKQRGVVAKLREKMLQTDITSTLEAIKPMQQEAIKKFNQRNYEKSLELFSTIIQKLDTDGVASSHPEYQKILKGFDACRRKAEHAYE